MAVGFRIVTKVSKARLTGTIVDVRHLFSVAASDGSVVFVFRTKIEESSASAEALDANKHGRLWTEKRNEFP